MTNGDSTDESYEFFEGLRALAESAFPKSCSCCGRVFENAEEFIQETEKIPASKSSLKTSVEDDGSTILEIFRNCPCGSTLMDEFSDRRDDSERGNKRRAQFAKMLAYLATQGVNERIATRELRIVLQGGTSKILSKIAPPK